MSKRWDEAEFFLKVATFIEALNVPATYLRMFFLFVRSTS